MAAENQEALTYDSADGGRTSIGDYAAVLRRRKWWILGPLLLSVGLTLLVALTSPSMYRASATVLVTDPPRSAGELPQSLSAKAYRNELTRAQSLPVQQAARKEIGSEPTLSAASGGGNTDLFVFTAESKSASRAGKAANAYAQAYADARGKAITDTLQAQVGGIDEQITAAQDELDALSSETSTEAEELNAKIEQLQAERERVQNLMTATAQANTNVLDPASTPRSRFSPRPVRDGITALVLGLIAGLALAFIVDALDQKLRTVRDTERATMLPVLSVVGHIRRWKPDETHLILEEAPTSPQAEAFRALRAKIQFRRMDEPLKTVLVTSAEPGDGKSSTAANLATAFAAVGDDTVVVDLDLRRPRLHEYFGLSNGPGAASVLSGGDYKGIYQTVASVPNLTFVSAGRSRIDASELLAGERLQQFFSVLTERFDTVIVDSPPILAVVDPLSIAQDCDGVLLVVSAGHTDSRKARAAAEQLSDTYAPTLGVLLNNFNEFGSGYGYSYDYEIIDDYVPEREPNPTLEDEVPYTATAAPAASELPSSRVIRTTPPSSQSTGTASPTQPQQGEWVVDTVAPDDVTTPHGVSRGATIETTFTPQSTAAITPATASQIAATAAAGATSTAANTGWSEETGARYIGTLFDQDSKSTASAAHNSAVAPAALVNGATSGIGSTNGAVNGTGSTAVAQLSVIEREELLLGALIVPGSGESSSTPVDGTQRSDAGVSTNGASGLGSPDANKADTSPTGLKRDDDEWEVLTEDEMRASIRNDMAEAIRERRTSDQPTATATEEQPASDDSADPTNNVSSGSKSRRKRRL